MTIITLKLGGQSDNDDNNNGINDLFSENKPNGGLSFYQIQVQTTWRKDSWVGKSLTDDEKYGFKPLHQQSLFGDIKETMVFIQNVFSDFLTKFNKGNFPVWINKSYTGKPLWECNIPITVDHHMFIKVRIYMKFVQYDEKGNLTLM